MNQRSLIFGSVPKSSIEIRRPVGSRGFSVVHLMLVFLLPFLIQRLSRPERAGGPTLESHTHERDGAGCSRCLSGSPRRKPPPPLQAVSAARGGQHLSLLRDDRSALPPGLGPAGFSGSQAHHLAEKQRIQREYPIETTTRISEPFNGGTLPYLAGSLNSLSQWAWSRTRPTPSRDLSRSGTCVEKETD